MRKVLPVTIIATVLLFFVSINVLVSQLYPSLMFKVLQFNDLAATKQFLAHIEGTPFYETQYAYLNKLFSNAFVADDIQAEFSLKSELDRLNNLLEKNQNNPQVLAEIALLHFDKGDLTQARQYYQQAQAIDPWLDIDELERIK